MKDKPRADRRTNPLTRDVIVQASVEILDAAGERALTFRALSAHLSTGAGAIYHHVASKSELLTAVTDEVIAGALHHGDDEVEPEQAIRAVMLDVFDAIDAHPWVGAQLAAEPWQPAVLRIFNRVGVSLEALDVPEGFQFDATSALVHHILGVAGQYAAGARLTGPDADRSAFLGAVAAQWATTVAADEYPFLARIAKMLSEHDDREQFRAGVDLILAGIAALR
ncbi:TetR/AcrR family transcriptional regulator [Arthrobacter ruber]|uniref:TetR/AcrR family transcriptional regulator n=1 Tax=Arthrobacter ruber TaxID=1258893 RepID=UPI000CF52F5D|nr:TetR family transcriptional regulator [Arthrobacter ruber]